MALVFKDSQVVVIAAESTKTHVQLGLTESLMPAGIEVPTVLYRHQNGTLQASTPTDMTDVTEIRPIVRGEIADETAFHYLLKVVYNSVVPAEQKQLPPAMYLVASLSWSRRQIERLVRYLFEEAGVPAVALGLGGMMAAYAYAASDCLVIDVGYEKTEITAVHGFEVDRLASTIVDVGGDSINKELELKIPNLTSNQIEDLKRSPIYEVLRVGQERGPITDSSASNGIDEDQDGVINIAAIVSSGNTREILEEREKRSNGEIKEVANVDLATNKFIDRDGFQIEVGRERFSGTERLIESIVETVGDVLYSLKPRQQQQVFENVILVGRGLHVAGLRERLAEQLEQRWVVKLSPNDPAKMSGLLPEPPLPLPGQPTPLETVPQGPRSLTVARVLDHFPEWRSQGSEVLGFLGAQIGAKQAFTAGLENVFVGKQDYNEAGPSCIWESFM